MLTTNKSEVGTLSIEAEKLLINKIIKRFSIGYIIHHPSKINNLNFDNVKNIDENAISEDIIYSSAFDSVFSLSASCVLSLVTQGLFKEDDITYLANKSSPHIEYFKKHTIINTFYFEDL